MFVTIQDWIQSDCPICGGTGGDGDAGTWPCSHCLLTTVAKLKVHYGNARLALETIRDYARRNSRDATNERLKEVISIVEKLANLTL